jgi:hypothetical protein
MYTFGRCESHDFCICHSTFLKSEHSRPLTKEKHIFFFFEGARKEEGIEKEKIQISHSSQGNRSRTQ